MRTTQMRIFAWKTYFSNPFSLANADSVLFGGPKVHSSFAWHLERAKYSSTHNSRMSQKQTKQAGYVPDQVNQ